VILELKDKMSVEEAFEKKTEHVQMQQASGNGLVKNDAVMALTALGYSSTESLRAVSAVEITGDMDVEAVLKAALKHLSLL
jgi:Holliday junction DNA helicase RuvA